MEAFCSDESFCAKFVAVWIAKSDASKRSATGSSESRNEVEYKLLTDRGHV